MPLCVLDLDSENILTLVSIARTTIRSYIYLGTDNNNKNIKILIHKNVESLVMFSPTGYSKKSGLLALSYINCLGKDFVHIQFLQYFKLILMLLFL